MEKQIRNFIRECDTCQRFKYDNSASPGLLQPLPIPEAALSQVSLDFIEVLPVSQGKSTVLVVVDRLTKYAHFMSLTHPYSALSVAQASLITCLNSMDFLLFSSVTEIRRDSTVHDVNESLLAREAMMDVLKFHLGHAQRSMKQQHDKHRSDRRFAIGDWVYLKLQPYRQNTLRDRQFHKLSLRFFGPFKIVDEFGEVAYKLALPADAKLHPVFHVSQLKKKVGPLSLLHGTLPVIGNSTFLNQSRF
ncbi:uncharacterized protein LOC121778123 [Salvia splendens]|uniref:uncharacterized protein LOC121778123 n=1 Tax=Salvia splendens TaxID=180675 RepID=UPI001C26AD09|nr:uncharacterized protein LOC121778123 [Salvia splendens]